MSEDSQEGGYTALRIAGELTLSVMLLRDSANGEKEAEAEVRALLIELANDPRATAEDIHRAMNAYFQLIQEVEIDTSIKMDFIAKMDAIYKRKIAEEIARTRT